MNGRIVRRLFGLLLAALFALTPRVASAYPWMIRHDYNVCAVCHTDPSGGNLLTAYGRSLSQTLLSSELLAKRDEEPGKFKDFAFGLVPTPENLQLGAYLRPGYLSVRQNGKELQSRSLSMRADLEAYLEVGKLRFDATVGALPGDSARSAQEAWVTRSKAGEMAVVARTYWVGYELFEGDGLLRVGRLPMPYGLRNVEHTSWVRAATRTDLNQHQQHGASLYWSNGAYRAEAMVVAGNFQLAPDSLRERGLVGYVERRISGAQALAVQAQVLRSAEAGPLGAKGSLLRQSYGAFYRVVPHAKLAILTEANLLASTFESGGTELGHVAFLQADYEPFAGVHVMGTLEEVKLALPGSKQGLGAWGSAVYFPVPHVEMRADVIHRKLGDTDADTTLLFQGQLYL
jgi:hypothetical protein